LKRFNAGKQQVGIANQKKTEDQQAQALRNR